MRSWSRGVRAGMRVGTTLCAIALLYAGPLSAANWVLLDGTEPTPAPTATRSPAYRPFGLVGIEYQHTEGSPIAAGPFKGQPLAPNRIAPRLEKSSQLQLSHVRLGLRGRLLGGRLDYFISLIAGDNAISHNGSPNVKLTDLSATLDLIPHARLRIGQFKHPGPEEGLRPAFLRDYIRPTNLFRQLVNERLFDSDGTPGNDANTFDGPLSGARDTGIQLFDAFRTGAFEHTYALMAGSGSGLAIYNGRGSGRPDWHLYWSSELILFDKGGGKGAMRDGLKLSGWYRDGKRELKVGTEQRTQTFDRRRYGLSTVFRRGPWYVAGEWVKAEGMIFNGTDGGAVPGSVSNRGDAIAGFNVLPRDEADGWYLEGGYRLCDDWELRARYDRLNRGTNGKATERRFETFTPGISYRPYKEVRLLIDYEFRRATAPGLSGNAVPNRILSRVDDLFGIKIWIRF